MYSGEAKARNVITMNYLIVSHMTERLSLYLSILAKAQTRLICRQVKKGNWSSLQISLFSLEKFKMSFVSQLVILQSHHNFH